MHNRSRVARLAIRHVAGGLVPRGSSSSRALSSSPSNISDRRAEYEETGFTILRNVLDADTMGEVQDWASWLMDKYPTIDTAHLHHTLMKNDSHWVSIVADDRLLDVAQGFEPFLADGVALFSSHMISKPPHSATRLSWHTDGSYWPLRPMNVLTCWLAVDPSTTENGCMQVVAGSHKAEELRELTRDGSEGNVLASATHTDAEVAAMQAEGFEVVDVELQPGDVSIHHPGVIHGSLPNTSPTQRRCGLTIRYMAPDTVCDNPDQPVMMLRGDVGPVEDLNRWYPWPKYRDGYDFRWSGADSWNARRHQSNHPELEAFFDRTDLATIDRELEEETQAFIAAIADA